MSETYTLSTYARLLGRWIDKSGLNLKEIAERCEAAGKPITASYISKLRSGAVRPPSYDVAGALAEALGQDPAPLYAILAIETFTDPDWRELMWTLIELITEPGPQLERLEQLKGMDLSTLPQVIRATIKDMQLQLGTIKQAGAVEPDWPDDVMEESGRLIRGHEVTLALPVLDGFPAGKVPARVIPGDGAIVGVDLQLFELATCAIRLPLDLSEYEACIGDLLLVGPAPQQLQSGDTILARVGGEVTARRYYEVRHGFRLEPPLATAGAAKTIDDIEILGIIHGLVRTA